MKSPMRNKLIEGTTKTVRRTVSMILCLMLLLSVFTALGLDFGIPALVAQAATDKSQTEYENIEEFQNAEFKKIQENMLGYSVTTDIVAPGTMTNRASSFVSGNDYFNWTQTGLTGDKVWTSRPTDCQDEITADGVKVIDGVRYAVFNVDSADKFYQACYMTTRESAGVQDESNKRFVSVTTRKAFRNYDNGSEGPTSNADKATYLYKGQKESDTYQQYNSYTGTYLSYTYWYAYPYIPEEDDYGYYEYVSENLSNYLINLTTDLDMYGYNPSYSNSGVNTKYSCWTPIIPQSTTDQRVYIEGNGHTIYNLKISTMNSVNDSNGYTGISAIFAYSPAYFAVKNLGFVSTMSVSTANPVANTSMYDQISLLCGFVGKKIFLENVHSNGGYFQGQYIASENSGRSCGVGGLVGRKQSGYAPTAPTHSGDNYIINCSTSNYVMYGGAHVGGMTSYIGCEDVEADSGQLYNSALPSDTQMFRNAMSEDQAKYPWVILNSYSTDSTIFSTAADSGSFISCGDSILAKNCYSNNTIYAHHNTGGFIGRSATIHSGLLRDSGGIKNINSYFDGCYSTGVVEGSVAMGGFIGLEMGFRDQNNIELYDTASNLSVSCDVFENCFSTAMVGMDYAGKYCGGFIGMDDNYYDGTKYDVTRNSMYYRRNNSNYIQYINTYTPSSDNKTPVSVNVNGSNKTGCGTWYVNCYAAGEVGNILTVTDRNKISNIYETEFFSDSKLSGRDHSNYEETLSDDILDYYPTGGFVGALGLDAYYNTVTGTSDHGYKYNSGFSIPSSTSIYSMYYRSNYSSTGSWRSGNSTNIRRAAAYYYWGDSSYYNYVTDEILQMAINADIIRIYYDSSTVNYTKQSANIEPCGNFYNCYYDMQTTAMREVGVGLANVESSRGTSSESFGIVGLKGIYTENSTKKRTVVDESGNESEEDMIGLTDMTLMDSSGSGSSNWNYADQYYPQIKAFMTADMQADQLTKITQSDVDALRTRHSIDAASSPFYIEDSASSVSSVTELTQNDEILAYSKPVLSLATVQRTNNIPTVLSVGGGDNQVTDPTVAAQMYQVVQAFRYSQAATSTVLLDHWDLTMNTSTGDALVSQNDNAPGLQRNQMSKVGKVTIDGEEVDLWMIEYTGLAVDTYKFKVQQGDSMAFNYGREKFAGDASDMCTLDVDKANSTARIYFAYKDLKSDYYKLYYELYYPDSENKVHTDGDASKTVEIHNPPAGFSAPLRTIAGSLGEFNSWSPAAGDTNTLQYSAGNVDSNGNHYYTITFPNMPDGEYEFKITGGSWEDNWGKGGVPGGNNMSFKLGAADNITITYTEETHLCTISATNSANLIAYDLGDHAKKTEGSGGVEGYSVLSQSEKIGAACHWYDDNDVTLEQAAQAGLMLKEDDNTYYFPFTLTDSDNDSIYDRNFAYKIIKDGADSNKGVNEAFSISRPTENDHQLSMRIYYYPNESGSDRYNVVAVKSDGTVREDVAINLRPLYTTYGLSGSAKLFGADREWDDSHSDLILRRDSNDSGVFSITLGDSYWSNHFAGRTEMPEGKYEFKVLADNSKESGVDYGNPGTEGTGNFVFNAVASFTSLTIRFDPTSDADVKITVETNPQTALDTNVYTITASKRLAEILKVPEWSKTVDEGASNAFLLYSNQTAKFEKWAIGVPANDTSTIDRNYDPDQRVPAATYGFKIIPVGVDRGENVVISLSDKIADQYDLLFEYDENKSGSDRDKMNIRVYEHNDSGEHNTKTEQDLASEVLTYIDANTYQAPFYAVLGAPELLDGKSWGGDDTSSILRGLMHWDEEEECYVLYENLKASGLKAAPDSITYSFKVACNGMWDISYPSSNYDVTLAIPEGATIANCEIEVKFFPGDGTTEPRIETRCFNSEEPGADYSFTYDESSFVWYISADGKLFDKNMFSNQSDPTVYDTVRDITSSFTFTYGLNSEQRGMTVVDDNMRNTADRFVEKDNFSLRYVQNDRFVDEDTGEVINRRSTVDGTFEADVIDLEMRPVSDEGYSGFKASDLLTQYYVDQFAPGKRWLKINTLGYGYSQDYMDWQTKFINHNQYLEDKKEYERYFELYLALCANMPYNNTTVNRNNLEQYLKDRHDNDSAMYNSFVEAENGYDIVAMKYDGYDKDGVHIPGLDARAVDDAYGEPDSVININNQSVIGAREIRLIPSTYLEAGVDAQVNVIQDQSDSSGDFAKNSVKLLHNNTGAYDQSMQFDSYIEDSSDGVNYTVQQYKDGEGNWQSNYDNLDDLQFGYYNYAMTAAYMSTDKVGLGIFNNYSDQHIVPYDYDEIRDEDSSDVRNSDTDGTGGSHRYYAMYSAYHDIDKYNDDAWYDEENNRVRTNLRAGQFENMSIVGSTYDDKPDSDKYRYNNEKGGYEELVVNEKTGENEWVSYREDSQTIVKVFKVQTDKRTGNYLYDENGEYLTTPVYFNTDESSASSYTVNYQKWSGRKNFVSDDQGLYIVHFYWTLEDGRYLEDTKNVTISVVEPGITKSTETQYDSSANGKQITYTLTYTNARTQLLIDFAILDILPFNGDYRYNQKTERTSRSKFTVDDSNWTTEEGGVIKTISVDDPEDLTKEGYKFKLKNVTIQQGAEKSDVREIYFTDSKQVRNWAVADIPETVDENGAVIPAHKSTNERAAENLNFTEGGYLSDSDGVHWTPLNQGSSSLHKYAPDTYNQINTGTIDDPELRNLDDDVTAICVTGMQLARGETVTIQFTLEYDGVIQDYFSNDAFYYIQASLDTSNTANGFSKPVGTAIVARDLSGYAWLDQNGNGIIDAEKTDSISGKVTPAEPRLAGMGVNLYRQQVNIVNEERVVTWVKWNDTPVKTDNNGYYIFKNLSNGTYHVEFVDIPDNDITLNGDPLQVVEFNQLRGTNRYNEINETRADEIGNTTHNITFANCVDITVVPEENREYTYVTPDVYLPSDASVYSMTANSVGRNESWVDYQYTKLYQNAGFGTVSSMNYNYSLAVTKTNDKGEPLQGVQFKLEHYVAEDDAWYPVAYETDYVGTVLEITHMSPNARFSDKYACETWGDENINDNGTTRTVYFSDSFADYKFSGGDKGVNIYYWKTNEDGLVVNTYDRSWPGVPMTDITGNYPGLQYSKFSAEIPSDANHVIFVSQKDYTTQTVDLDLDNTISGFYPTGLAPLEPEIRTSDENGELEFSRLIEGKYRLVETKTINGYLAYPEPIEFELPYKLSSSVDPKDYEDGKGNFDSKVVLSQEFIEEVTDTDVLYNHIGINVINHKNQLSLPLTGTAEDMWIWLLIAFIIFGLGVLSFFLVFRNKDKLAAIKIPTQESVLDRIKKGK